VSSRRALPLGAVIAVLLAPAAARGAVPVQDIASGGPLTHVYVGNELSCQVAHAGDPALEIFPASATPGSCGTLVAVGDALYAPDFANHDGSATASLGPYTPFTAVSQTGVTGAGTTPDPFRVVTVADVGTTGLRITETDSYVAGQESYRTDVSIANTGGAPVAGVIYRAGDCFLQGADQGYGFVDSANQAVGCSINPNNTPAGRIEQWFPLTAGNQYLETSFSEGWSAIGARQPLPDTCRCGEQIDNWSGLSWSFNVPVGGQSTFSHFTTFSPTGEAGPPTSVPAPVLGKSVNVKPVAGDVFVKLPRGASAGAAQTKGQGFVPLAQARQVPVGSILDVRRGTVRLTSAANTAGATQSGDFFSGIFQVLQARRRRGLTDLHLKGRSFASCRTGAGKGSSARRKLKHKVINLLSASAKGRFRTSGRYASATVRGTAWDTVDRCDGTIVGVARGVVVVDDFRRHRRITVRAGKSYFARAR
jgi:hypothetical protein